MTTREAPLLFLRNLAAQREGAARKWRALGRIAFAGEIAVATDNSDYRFVDGVFAGRAKKPARSLEQPAGMQGLLLVGFLVEDLANDRWQLVTAWRAGAHAVLWRPGPLDARSFVITSPTVACVYAASASGRPVAQDPEPSPWLKPVPESGIVKLQRPVARPPLLRVPEPPSMTRLHPAVAPPPPRSASSL